MLLHGKWFALAVCTVFLGCTGALDVTTPEDAPDGSVGGAVTLTGTLVGSQVARTAPGAESGQAGYMVIAQSDATGEVYRGTTDAVGDFEIDIPAAESGNSFMVTILGPDGRAVGPVLFGVADGNGLAGLKPEGETALGTIELPDDLTTSPIEVGADADLTGLLDADLTTRLNAGGVPVGLASHGKGGAAQNGAGPGPGPGGRLVDADRDGLIDILDADDDGDGIVDDFDGDGDTGGIPSDIRVNFFMNLKISAEQASTYYNGTAAEISAALAADTVITFEALPEPGSARTITAVEALETPGPTYMPDADVMSDTGMALAYTNWGAEGYAFGEAADRFEAFVRPNDEMEAGDTFTIDVSFDDGTTEQYSRMINYVFKNIPTLVRYGASGALTDFDIADATVNGTLQHPIPVDGTQDLVLLFNPPPDETGAYLTGLDYSFQIFYFDADGVCLNEEIDGDATWPTRPAGFQGTSYWINADDLTLAADDTYTMTLPQEVLPDTIQTNAGEQKAVAQYKIDITAEAPTGNAAIMLAFVKQ
ncbi:MAG: hypothetical protein KKB50_11895 [Planctomycetes bacterium]|nr:hypothetical protein [Planctomycetota bacterium]